MAIERIPPARAGEPDEMPFRGYGSGGLGPDAQMKMIGGSYHVSTRLDPETALTGGYQAINGDTMPAGAPVDGNPPYTGPYLPKN
jgi:hypothetical protein